MFAIVSWLCCFFPSWIVPWNRTQVSSCDSAVLFPAKCGFALLQRQYVFMLYFALGNYYACLCPKNAFKNWFAWIINKSCFKNLILPVMNWEKNTFCGSLMFINCEWVEDLITCVEVNLSFSYFHPYLIISF